MGPGDSLHRATPPCSLDAQQDHPEGHRELQNHARAEGISEDIEDKIIMTQDTSTYYVWIGGVGVKIVQYHKSPLLIETHDRATEAMAKTRKEFHQKNKYKQYRRDGKHIPDEPPISSVHF